MTTLRTPPKSKLGIDLQAFRTDRPYEWWMDDFTREAEKMQDRITELETLIKESDDYLNTNSMTSICSGSILHTKFKQALKDNS